MDDAIELFFLQVQGSGRIALDSGETLRVGYADQNGFPYRSIGRHLAERGELPLEKASMQGIQAWARANPDKVTELLNHNASYVFFRELPAGLPGPLGALGVPLTPRRSVAVDPGIRAARRSGLHRDHLAALQPAAQPPDAGAGYGQRHPRRGARGLLLGIRR